MNDINDKRPFPSQERKLVQNSFAKSQKLSEGVVMQK